MKQELTEQNLVPEEWGGKTPMVAISAKKGQGVDDLLETVRGVQGGSADALPPGRRFRSRSSEWPALACPRSAVHLARPLLLGGFLPDACRGAGAARPPAIWRPVLHHVPCTVCPPQVLLVAELEELQSNPERAARGTVLEASLDKKAGAVCSLLVQAGTLRVGDAVQAGSAYGKVRGRRRGAGRGAAGLRCECGRGGAGKGQGDMGLASFPRWTPSRCPWSSIIHWARGVQGVTCLPHARRPHHHNHHSIQHAPTTTTNTHTPPPAPSLQVRSMRNPQGDVAEAGPSLAVQMLGLNGVPQAGDEFTVYESEADARVAGTSPSCCPSPRTRSIHVCGGAARYRACRARVGAGLAGCRRVVPARGPAALNLGRPSTVPIC